MIGCKVSLHRQMQAPVPKEEKMFVMDKIDNVKKLTVHEATERLNSDGEQQK